MIEEEIIETCDELIELIMTKLFPSTLDQDYSRVFYMKQLGDLYRFKSELDFQDEESARLCEHNYSEGMRVGMECLETQDPLLLSIFLNFAVYYYDIKE